MGPTMSCRLSVEYGRESAGNRRHQRDPIDFKFALGQRKREDLGIDKIERLIISGSGVRNPDGALQRRFPVPSPQLPAVYSSFMAASSASATCV